MSEDELKESGSKVLWKSEAMGEAKSETTCISFEPDELIYYPSTDEFSNIIIKDNKYAASSEIIAPKHRKVEFENEEGDGEGESSSEINIREDIATVEEIFGFYAPPITQREFVGPIQSYTQVKERPSKLDTRVITMARNRITLKDYNDVDVTPTDAINNDFPEEFWEVSEGYDILKLLNPHPYVPIKVSAHTDLRQIAKLVPEHNKEFEADVICSEFLSPESVARCIVRDTILSATRELKRRVLEYGTPKPKYKDIFLHQKLSSRWPSIKNFTKERGKEYISKYINQRNYFLEDWKYNIVFDSEASEKLSDHYVYEAKFGLPTKLYPIPQVTASIYFFMEVSKVLPSQCPIKVTLSLETSRRKMEPHKFVLRDNILLKILDEKILNLKVVTF